MPLIFEYEKDISTGMQPFISHERDSTLYNYFIDSEMAKDTNGVAAFGHYGNILFGNEDRHLTTKAVSRIGIKNFPGIGGIGFYRDAYSDESKILAPIHTTNDKYDAPFLKTVEIVDSKLHIVITPPDTVKYTCYRVVVRQKAFAFEYITYKEEAYVQKPTVKGDFYCYCIGYDEAMGTVSEDSNELPLVVETGNSDWNPEYTPGKADIAALEHQIAAVDKKIGDIGSALDVINGVEV